MVAELPLIYGADARRAVREETLRAVNNAPVKFYPAGDLEPSWHPAVPPPPETTVDPAFERHCRVVDLIIEEELMAMPVAMPEAIDLFDEAIDLFDAVPCECGCGRMVLVMLEDKCRK